ncbi:hypothetical protein KJ611_00270 [Patescibacteria group bacterium]|nr:hypothetical protein [Patescibacteria group bacterium]MBU1705182.1 hypothetical protein [Patescibacteria group bacterium]
MTQYLMLDREQLFQEIVENGRAQGVVDQEAYHSLVDSMVEGHLEVGEYDKDQALPELIEDLKARWSDYQKTLE